MNRKSKVIFLHSSSELYGSSKILLYVMAVVQNLGYSVLVLLPGEGPLQQEMERLGFEVKIINLGILRRKYFNPLGLVNRIRRFRKAYKFLKKLHHQEEIALIYSNTLAVMVGAVFAVRKGIPHTWHIHELIQSPKFLISFLAEWLDKSSPEPIVVSEAVAAHWQKHLKIARPKVIHNGIDYRPFLQEYPQARKALHLPEDKTIITMIGRINPGKGQLFFLEMAKLLLHKHSDIHFVLVGDPYPGYENIQQDIQDFVHANRLEAYVTDLGFRTDIPRVLKASDIFVLPSILPDSFPTVVLEAMAAGLPVLATRSGGAGEMIHEGETGYLIKIGDIREGTKTLSQLISDPVLAKAMGKKGQEKVLRDFSFESFNKNMEDYLCRMLTQKN